MLNLRFIKAARTHKHLSQLLIAISLSSCGGGGDDGFKSYPQLTISGTAAIGAPIANTPLIIKCVGSTATPIYTYYDTTDANGAYSKRIDAASAPCVITIQFTDSSNTQQSLSSYTKTLSDSTVANITPLSNTMLSVMMGAQISTYSVNSRTNVLSDLKTALEQNSDQTAWTKLKAQLTSRGIDTSAITNHPVTDAFSADANNIHQGHDKLLDDLVLNRLLSPQLYQLAGGPVRFESVAQTNDAEVLDKITGLVWQRCVVGMVWDGTSCSGSYTPLLWSQLPQLLTSQPLSSATGASPWRVPTFNELASLHDATVSAPPYIVDKKWFPTTPAYWTWTSSPKNDSRPQTRAPVIAFHRTRLTGYLGEDTDQLVVRLVR
jgi:hypothetical protein